MLSWELSWLMSKAVFFREGRDPNAYEYLWGRFQQPISKANEATNQQTSWKLFAPRFFASARLWPTGAIAPVRFEVIVILDSHAEVTVGWLASWQRLVLGCSPRWSQLDGCPWIHTGSCAGFWVSLSSVLFFVIALLFRNFAVQKKFGKQVLQCNACSDSVVS